MYYDDSNAMHKDYGFSTFHNQQSQLTAMRFFYGSWKNHFTDMYNPKLNVKVPALAIAFASDTFYKSFFLHISPTSKYVTIDNFPPTRSWKVVSDFKFCILESI